MIIFAIITFQSLLHVLRESHRTRTVFRRVGGFVYVMSVLVSMEGCLADPPKHPWNTGSSIQYPLHSTNMCQQPAIMMFLCKIYILNP